ncbi:hypothetical protein LCGC14_2264710 [marine sediment metagenome]|uniref:Uncharacterized protein n=1 Tax=marine sediment metagenome TaxID=412755 RepID=A0A0F9CYX9_9ZZZZ
MKKMVTVGELKDEVATYMRQKGMDSWWAQHTIELIQIGWERAEAKMKAHMKGKIGKIGVTLILAQTMKDGTRHYKDCKNDMIVILHPDGTYSIEADLQKGPT